MDGAGLQTSVNKMYVASRIRVLVLHVIKLMELRGSGFSHCKLLCRVMLWLYSIPCELRPVKPKVWIIMSYCMAVLEVLMVAGLYSRRPHHEGLPCAQNRMPTGKLMTGELGNQVSKVFEYKWVWKVFSYFSPWWRVGNQFTFCTLVSRKYLFLEKRGL
jgi:hypothetical protein